MIVTLPNGQKLEFPEGTSQDTMRQAIAKNFPEFASRENKQSTFEGLLRGAGKGVGELFNLPLNLAEYLGEKNVPYFKQVAGPLAKRLKGFEPTIQTRETTSEAIGQVLPALLAPEVETAEIANLAGKIPKAGKYLENALRSRFGQAFAGQAIPQEAISAASALEEKPDALGEVETKTAATIAPFALLSSLLGSKSPAVKTIGKLGGFGLGAAGAESLTKDTDLPMTVRAPLDVLSGYLVSRGFNPRKSAQSVLEGVDLEKARPALEASKRLGLEYLTPAEATGSPFLGAKQGDIGRTKTGAQLLYERGMQRESSEEKAINELLDTIYDTSSLEPQKIAAYEESLQKPVTGDFIDKYKDNDIIAEAARKLERDPAYRQELKNISKGTVGYFDQIKRVLDGMEETAKRGSRPDKNKARIVNKTKKDMVSDLDVIAPNYEDARSLAERDIARDKILNAFDKKEVKGQNLFKLLQSEKKFNELLHSLRAVPAAQEKLKDMRLVFRNLISTPTARTAAALQKTSMSKMRNQWDALANYLEGLFGGKHDVAAVNLMTNPNWDEIATQILKEDSKPKKLQYLINALGKATAQTATQERVKRD